MISGDANMGVQPIGLVKNVPDKSDQDRMPLDVTRAVAGEIDIRCYDTATISAHYLHGYSSSALEAAPHITAIPSKA